YKRKEKSEADDSQKADQKERKTQENELEDQHDTIESLQIEKNELFAKLQRVSADYANFQKRVPKQITDSIGYEKERIIKTLLPALDNFEHTLQNAHSAENVDVLVKGIRIIYDQLLDILKSHNVEQIEALGERFDPAMHQAMTQQSDPEKEEDTVLQEFQKGYRLNGRVIRPSKVIVNKLPEELPEQQQDDEDENNDSE
ncbi:nucleotide exchange factor GrpE, partial [Planctomycetota bacterium]